MLKWTFFFILLSLAASYAQQTQHAPSSTLSGQLSSKLQLLWNSEQTAVHNGDADAVMTSAQQLSEEALHEIEGVRAKEQTVPHPSAAVLKALKIRENLLTKILASAFNDWGTAEARQRKYEEALAHFQEAERWDAGMPNLMRNIGVAAFRLGKYEEAVRALTPAAANSPADDPAHLMLAISLFSVDKYAEAAEAFSHSGNTALQDPRAAYAWAASLARSNHQLEANKLLDSLTAQDQSTDVMSLYCQLYIVTENYEHAVTCYRKLYTKDPAAPMAHFQAGVALIRLNRPTEAIAEFREELKINPDNSAVQYNLAYALLETSHKDEAAVLLWKVVAADPDYPQAQYQLGKMLLADGKSVDAIAHLEVAAKGDPSKDYIHYQLQIAYRRAGRIEDSDRELKIYREIKAQQRQASGRGMGDQGVR